MEKKLVTLSDIDEIGGKPDIVVLGNNGVNYLIDSEIVQHLIIMLHYFLLKEKLNEIMDDLIKRGVVSPTSYTEEYT